MDITYRKLRLPSRAPPMSQLKPRLPTSSADTVVRAQPWFSRHICCIAPRRAPILPAESPTLTPPDIISRARVPPFDIAQIPLRPGSVPCSLLRRQRGRRKAVWALIASINRDRTHGQVSTLSHAPAHLSARAPHERPGMGCGDGLE